MAPLPPIARRRAAQIRLRDIERKITKVQAEIDQLEQQPTRRNPGLFGQEHRGLEALRDRLEFLEGVARRIRKKLAER